jgi:UDP-2,3-diacylglucosamine pyrophosphatase LpxH
MSKEYRPRLSEEEYNVILERRNNDERRILVIGDLHAPFIKFGYLEFCKEMQTKWKTNKTIFVGDIIDNHYSSYHETDPDGHSAGSELLKAKNEISNWYKAFTNAKVCLGNHDLLPYRKAMTSGLSNTWIKTIDEVLETPLWEYSEEFIIDNVMYTHGTGRKARKRAQKDLMSVVQGHYHNESYVENFVGENFKIFAMQIGCGVDRKSYGMAYGRHFDKPHLNCGIVLENGTLPIIEMMKL